MLIKTKTGKIILIDGGEDNNILLPYLLDKKINKIDYVIISHFDSDHYAGIIPLIGKISIKNIIISKQSEKNFEVEEFIELVNKNKIDIKIVSAGDEIYIDKSTNIEILWPTEKSLKGMNLNDNSIVARLNYEGLHVLSTGDISETVDNFLIENYPESILKSDILKVAHHGSKTSSSLKFIEKVSPKIALIGVGKNNKFGHPNKEVIFRLEDLGSKIYRTDQNGEISIEINQGGKIKIETFLEQKFILKKENNA